MKCLVSGIVFHRMPETAKTGRSRMYHSDRPAAISDTADGIIITIAYNNIIVVRIIADNRRRRELVEMSICIDNRRCRRGTIARAIIACHLTLD